jgi:hypothetical protein
MAKKAKESFHTVTVPDLLVREDRFRNFTLDQLVDDNGTVALGIAYQIAADMTGSERQCIGISSLGRVTEHRCSATSLKKSDLCPRHLAKESAGNYIELCDLGFDGEEIEDIVDVSLRINIEARCNSASTLNGIW